jgi:hypothetical protein
MSARRRQSFAVTWLLYPDPRGPLPRAAKGDAEGRAVRMKYPADLERERRTAEIVRQLREARAQVPPSYPPVRDWRRAA